MILRFRDETVLLADGLLDRGVTRMILFLEASQLVIPCAPVSQRLS